MLFPSFVEQIGDFDGSSRQSKFVQKKKIAGQPVCNFRPSPARFKRRFRVNSNNVAVSFE